MYSRTIDLMRMPLEMTVTTSNVGGSFSPEIFGPSFWFTLHNGAVAYFNNPTVNAQRMMKMFISSLPIIIPCGTCKEHAYTYLQHQDLDSAVRNRRSLFDFILDFHNYVNAKNGVPLMTKEQAEDLYGYYNQGAGGSVKITYK